MSKASATRRAATPPPRRRRLNLKALVILVALCVAALPALIGVKMLREQRGRKSLLVEARAQLAKGQYSLALGYLNRYLELDPDDTEALDLKAKTMAETASTREQIEEAVKLHTIVLGRDPNGPARVDTRRRMLRLSLDPKVPFGGPSVEKQARELIRTMAANGGADADAHRLLGRTLARAAGFDADPKTAAVTLDEARKEFLAAEALDPGDVDGAAELASLYREKLEKPGDAFKVLDNLVAATAKDPKKHASALLVRAVHLDASGKLKEAEADLDQALKDDPGNIKVRLEAVEVALRRRDTATARQHLAAIPPERAKDLEVQIAQGLADWAELRPEEAIRTWRAGLINSGGNNADLAWRLANLLLEVGRTGEAVELIERYRQLAGDAGSGPRYQYLKAVAAVKQSQFDEALKIFEAIQYKVDKDVEASLYYWMGQAYQAKADRVKALDAYLRSTERAREYAMPWLAAAELQATGGKVGDAAATLRRGLSRMPGHSHLMAALARALRIEQMAKPESQRDWSEVDALLKQADALAPGSPDVALIRAEYLNVRYGPAESLALLETACRQRPKAAPLWIGRANLTARQGDVGKALDLLQEGLKQAGPKAEIYVTMSSLLVAKGDVTKAKGVLQEGLATVPAGEKATLWKTLGDVHLVLRDYASARAAYEALAKLQPGNPEPGIALVEVALAEGDEATIETAIKALRQGADANGPKSVYWKAARASQLLRDGADGKPDRKRIDDAEALVDQIRKDNARLDLVPMLLGRIAEKRADLEDRGGRPGKKQEYLDKALAEYKTAYALNPADAAVDAIVGLLVREGREGEIPGLTKTLNAKPGQLEQRAAVTALRLGKKGKAEELAKLAVAGSPAGMDLRAWQAEVLKALGKPEEAEAGLKQVVLQKPEDPTPWLQLLMLQISQRKTKDAEATVELIREKVKSDYPELLWAQCYRSVGNVVRAAECYRDALKRWPNDRSVLASAVTFYDQAGMKDAAESTLRAVLNSEPSDGWARRQLALSLSTRTGNLTAWREALKVVGPDPQPNDRPDDLIARARVYSQGPTPEDRRKGIEILKGLLRELPDLAQVNELLARMLFAADDPQGAKVYAAKAAAGDRANLDAVFFYASVLFSLKDFDGVEAQLARLAKLDADGLPVIELKARLAAARGKPGDGTAALEKAFDDRVGTPEAMFVGEKMITLLQSLGQKDAAERVARKTAAIAPRGRCLYARTLADAGKLDEAQTQLEEAAKSGDPASAAAVALDLLTAPKSDPRWLGVTDRLLTLAEKLRPDAVELFEKHALVRHFQKRYKDEVAFYHAILARKPATFLFLNNMAWTLSEELNDPKQAIAWANQAVEKLGPQPAVLDTRGVILTRLAKYADAVRDFEEATRSNANPSFLFHLAVANKKRGKVDAAKADFDRAKQAGLTRDQLSGSEQADWDALMNP